MCKIFKVQIFFAFTLVGCILLSACMGNNDDTNKGYTASEIKIGYTSTYGSSVLHLMMLTNMIEEFLPNDVSVKWFSLENANNNRDALVSGSTDVGSQTMISMVTSIANDLPLVFLANSVVVSAKVYSADSDILSLGDIKSSDKIALSNLGGMYQFAIELYCKDKYGDAKLFQNNYIAMAYPEMFASVLTSDDISCVVLTSPYIQMADQSEKLFEIMDLTSVLSENNVSNVISANKDFYENNPVLIEALNKAIDKATRFMNEQPSEAAKIIAEWGNAGDNVKEIEENIKRSPPTIYFSESAYNKVSELMYEVGMIQSQPKMFSELPNYDSIPKTE
jgi:NitT/TauT family transport system substrate-binding protein